MVRFACVALLFVLSTGGSTAQDSEAKEDLAKLQGKWKAVAALQDGKDDPQLETWTFVQNKLTISRNPNQPWTITLDTAKRPNKRPRFMDMTRSEPPFKLKAIYHLDGDALRVCFDTNDKARPEHFESKPGSGKRLVILKRVQTGENPEQLQKELDLLKKERDLLQGENETLKKENTALKKSKGIKPEEEQPKDAVMQATLDKVDYVYQGSIRNGNMVIVSVLATSKEGNRQEPRGQMTLIDEEGNKYVGHRVRDTGPVRELREGIAIKLQWEFGGGPDIPGRNLPTAPPAKIKRFTAVIIDHNFIGSGMKTIEFRQVPFTLAKPK